MNVPQENIEPLDTAEVTPAVRVTTVVWGAVVIVIGTLIILARQTNLSLDPGQSAMWLLFAAGVAMVAGGAVHVLRGK